MSAIDEIVLEENQKIGNCKWCGEKRVPIFTDTKLCETCDDECCRCSICKQLQHRDDHCRHIFENRDFEWRGAGVHIDDDLKPPLFKLFDLMPDGFVSDLRKAIRSGRFHTWLVAPLIGGGGILELNGMPDRDGKWMVHEWGDCLIEIGGGERAEETVDGYRWLVSLYDKKTLKANRVTIGWIDEWLKAKAPA